MSLQDLLERRRVRVRVAAGRLAGAVIIFRPSIGWFWNARRD